MRPEHWLYTIPLRLRSLRFQTPPLNVAVLATAARMTAAVCFAACLMPSQRAAQISSMQALAEE